MAATRKLISGRVGDGGAKSGADTRAVQELLTAAGNTDPNVSGIWGNACNKALNAAQERHGRPIRNYVDPDDDVLLDLCKDADILIPINGGKDITGVKHLDMWAWEERVPYEPGADKGLGTRSFYGLTFQGKQNYVIQRNQGWRAGPVNLNCTTWANLLLSVYLQGNAHNSPYDADCSKYGSTSTNHIARERYLYTLVRRPITGKSATENWFEINAEQIVEYTNLNTMYQIEVAKGSQGGVTHMVLMYNYVIYECTTGQSHSACITRDLDGFLATKNKGQFLYIFAQPGAIPAK